MVIIKISYLILNINPNLIVDGWVYAPVSIALLIYVGLIIVVLRAPVQPLMERKESDNDEDFDKVVRFSHL